MDSDCLSSSPHSPQPSRQPLCFSGSTLDTPNGPSFMEMWPRKCPEGNSGMRPPKSQDTLRGFNLCPVPRNLRRSPTPWKWMSNLGRRSREKEHPPGSSRDQELPVPPWAVPAGPSGCPGTRLGGAGHKAQGQGGEHRAFIPREIPLECSQLCAPCHSHPKSPGDPRDPPACSSPSEKYQSLKEPVSCEGLEHFSLSPFPGDIEGKKTEEEEEEDKWSHEGGERGRWETQKQGEGEAVQGAQQLKPP